MECGLGRDLRSGGRGSTVSGSSLLVGYCGPHFSSKARLFWKAFILPGNFSHTYTVLDPVLSARDMDDQDRCDLRPQ